ncbi:MAG: Spx/MgsR family RNA polymerase-binding regulatory protein [Mycoplasmataceae bacterium]|jgi:regulatory protein spx|nr:Spx/MgsR family RNA polymerase-binding regulatory protein [Mycoplasmataceae bacterium]
MDGLKIYVTPGCLGCRLAMAFFDRHCISYIKKNILKEKLKPEEIMDILSLSENGFDDILSTRSKEHQQKRRQINNYTIGEMIELIILYPQILSRPIIIQYHNSRPQRLLIGYNSNDIEIFLRGLYDQKPKQATIPSPD